MGTTWKAPSDAADIFEGRDRATGTLKWTATRVDLVFGDTLALYRWLVGTAPRGAAGFVGDEVLDAATFGAGAGIAFRRDDRDLGQLVDRALVEMTRDGTLDRLAAHWFPFAIR